VVSNTRNRDFTLHIGYPRTGTTFIQEHILPNFDSVQALAKPRRNFLEGGPSFGTFGRFFQRSPRIWEAYGEQLFSSLFGSSDEEKGETGVLVSDESLGITLARDCSYAGSVALGGSSQTSSSGAENAQVHIPHLHELSLLARQWQFTRVRAVVVVRRQDTWLPSAYVQESTHRKDPSQTDFQEHVSALLDPQRRLYEDGVVLDYYAVGRGLMGALGEENVLILPYEMMKKDPADFFAHWVGFLDLSEGDAVPLKSLIEQSTLRALNTRAMPGNRWAVYEDGAEEGGVIKLTEEVSQQIMTTFRESNRCLNGMIEPDLKGYGYY
jgi:hypothetical protein